MTDPQEFLDLSSLSGTLLEKAKNLTWDDIKDFGPSTLLDSWHLMANVINLKIDWNSNDTIRGYKIWNDADAKKNHSDWDRPDQVIIHVMKNGKDWKDIPLKKEYFTDQNEWEWNTGEEAEKGAEYTVVEELPSDYEYKDFYVSSIQGYDITNNWVENAPGKTTVSGKKIWEDENDLDGIRPDKITVKLYADGEPAKYTEDESAGDEGEEITAEVSKESGWKWTFTNLPKYKNGTETEIKYTVQEVEVPEGYEAVYDENSRTITNTHTPETINIEVTKEWNAPEDPPDSITVRLKADGKEVAAREITADDDWTWTFENQPKANKGRDITYTVSEDTVEGYTTEITKEPVNSNDGNNEPGEVKTIKFKVTNTYNPDKTQVSVSKVWEDGKNRDGFRPASVDVKLLANGENTGKVITLNDENQWTGSFTELDKKKAGKDIVYTVEEVLTDVITGKDGAGTYAAAVTGDMKSGFTVTNTHTPEKITIKGEKIWDDDGDRDGKRPARITIRLLGDGGEVKKKVVSGDDITEDGNWTWSFENLPKYVDGEAIEYTVTEDAIEDYEKPVIKGSAEEGFTITNKHTPETITLEGEKVWDDADDQDGKRPDSVTLHVKANGKEVKKVTVTEQEDTGWTWKVDNLPKNENGEAIEYTITEDAVADYEKPVIVQDEDGKYIITNKHIPETIQIEGVKVWKDGDNQDEKRPESVTIQLKADGEVAETVTVTEETDWKWSFKDIPKYNAGKEIEYSIAEEAVDGYTTVIKGSVEEGYTVTNIYTPYRIQIKGKKAWEDKDNQDGIRPESITIRLKADGEEVKSVEVTEEDEWMWSFDDLPQTPRDGIKYTITEDTVTNYETNIEGTADEGFIVTNTYVPRIQVNGKKVWAGDQEEDRPESITIRLKADGKEVKSVDVTAADEWMWSFDDLPQSQNGKNITYTVTEDPVTKYETNIEGNADEGFTVTNTYMPDLYTITYDLNGGTYAGSTADIKERYQYNTVISIHEKPKREGYTFLYWKGSKYQPGDKYTVVSDHTFVAQWKKKPESVAGTGDDTNLLLLIFLMLLSGTALVVLERFRRKHS